VEREKGGVTYISQHVVQSRWLWTLPIRVIATSVFCLFFLEVQEEFVVGEESGLGVLDLWVVC
jgi:hypothetical protein